MKYNNVVFFEDSKIWYVANFIMDSTLYINLAFRKKKTSRDQALNQAY